MGVIVAGYVMSDFLLVKSANDLVVGRFKLFSSEVISHGVSTRIHGTSEGVYSSLNLGLNCGDAQSAVLANRRLFCEATGVSIDNLVAAEQVHGAEVAIVDKRHVGRGATSFATAMKGLDALVTAEPDVSLILFFADCVPLLFFDPVLKVIGLAHAGWRGTLAGIGPRTLQAMQYAYGCRAEDCIVGIGPSIAGEDYEVDEKVFGELNEAPESWHDFATASRDGHWNLDLWGLNRFQLISEGVLPEYIKTSGVSTLRNTALFFSYRAENGKTGRLGAMISLKK